jgi:two-component system, OmpR family, KDP operon response regulator KdpE
MALILVVDDDPQIRQWVQDVLESDGLEVVTATEGLRALELAARRPPALVVLDVTLPGLHGAEIARGLRRIAGQQLPILVITADGRATEKAAQAQAFAYLCKPFSVDELLTTVRRGLGE